jgi:sugar phosphate isomerase/epimerase
VSQNFTLFAKNLIIMQKSNPRRKFLKNTTTLLAAGTILQNRMLAGLFDSEDIRVKHLGVQLWSVREDMKKDARETIKSLAKMGYKEVEGFGYKEGRIFNYAPHDFKLMLDDFGIRMHSSHVMLGLDDYDSSSKSVKDNIKKAFNDAARIGQKYVVCPFMHQPERQHIDKLIPVYQAAAAYAKSVGLRMGYHNHDFEYVQKGPDGRLLIEWLLTEVDPKDFAMQMDIYWVYFANQKPLDWITKCPGRWELCHAKDMAKSEKRETIEVGDGVVNFTEIFRQAKLAGLKYYVVELEDYKTTPLQGVQRALAGFKGIKK